MTFPVLEDGLLGEGTFFHDTTHLIGKEVGVPDGVKVDETGKVLFITADDYLLRVKLQVLNE